MKQSVRSYFNQLLNSPKLSFPNTGFRFTEMHNSSAARRVRSSRFQCFDGGRRIKSLNWLAAGSVTQSIPVEMKWKARNIGTSCATVNKKQTNRTKSILSPPSSVLRSVFPRPLFPQNTFRCPFPSRYTIKRSRVRKCSRVRKKTRNERREEWSRSETSKGYLPPTNFFLLSSCPSSSSSTTCPFFFFPRLPLPLSFFFFFLYYVPLLRTRNGHSSCRPISLNSRGVREFRGKAKVGKRRMRKEEP